MRLWEEKEEASAVGAAPLNSLLCWFLRRQEKFDSELDFFSTFDITSVPSGGSCLFLVQRFNLRTKR